VQSVDRAKTESGWQRRPQLGSRSLLPRDDAVVLNESLFVI